MWAIPILVLLIIVGSFVTPGVATKTSFQQAQQFNGWAYCIIGDPYSYIPGGCVDPRDHLDHPDKGSLNGEINIIQTEETGYWGEGLYYWLENGFTEGSWAVKIGRASCRERV